MILVLFDIDGTLLDTGGAGRAALKRALEQVYGAAGPIETYDMGGRTIREIVRDLLGAAGMPPEAVWAQFDDLLPVWADTLREVIGNYPVRPCPGALELVQALRDHPAALPGLLTANTGATAQVKLVAAGYEPGWFAVSAFGDRSEVRADLVPAALGVAQRVTGHPVEPRRAWHVGDSPSDMQAAQAGGIRGLGVLTNGATREAMLAGGADAVVDDLSDTARVMGLLLEES